MSHIIIDRPRFWSGGRLYRQSQQVTSNMWTFGRKQEARTPLPNQDRLRAAQQLPLRALPAPA